MRFAVVPFFVFCILPPVAAEEYHHQAMFIGRSGEGHIMSGIPWLEYGFKNGLTFQARENFEPGTFEATIGKRFGSETASIVPEAVVFSGKYRGLGPGATFNAHVGKIKAFAQVSGAKGFGDYGSLITNWTDVQFEVTERVSLGFGEQTVHEFGHDHTAEVHVGPSARINLKRHWFVHAWPRIDLAKKHHGQVSFLYGLGYRF